MTSDADKYWKSIVGKLRRAQGMCPLSPEEAEVAYDSAPDMPLTAEEIRQMTEAAMSGDLLNWDQEVESPWDESAYENADERSLQVFRNEGELDSEAEKRERDLEDKLLNDDEPEEQV